MSSTSDNSCNNKESGTSKSNDYVCDVNNMLQNLSTANDVSVCANCGKEGDEVNNTCNKCKMVKYCNAVCKKVHKKKHKKDCEEHVRQAAERRDDELRRVAKLHDEELFNQPSPPEKDCPICFLRMPTLDSGRKYMSCCGKVICCGCLHAPLYDDQGNEVDKHKCPFCRIPTPHTGEEIIKRYEKRIESGDAHAIYNLGVFHARGLYGFTRDYTKALEHWHRAAVDHTAAYTNIGYAYERGEGVEVDKKKAFHYYELSAIMGNEVARYNLGCIEKQKGNIDRAIKHYMIALRAGDADSLTAIQSLYSNGHASKEDYTTSLRSYQEYLGEIKSRQRDEAAATDEEYRYY